MTKDAQSNRNRERRASICLLALIAAIGLFAPAHYCPCGPSCGRAPAAQQDAAEPCQSDSGCGCSCGSARDAASEDASDPAGNCCDNCFLQEGADPIILSAPQSPRPTQTSAPVAIIDRKCLSLYLNGRVSPMDARALPRGSPTYLQLEILLI